MSQCMALEASRELSDLTGAPGCVVSGCIEALRAMEVVP
jgi:hypothetical protein